VLIQDSSARHHSTRLSWLPKRSRLIERFEWHYTPKHGSWLDLEESELSLHDKQTLIDEIAAWRQGRMPI
jgi:hypothetical protein